MKQCEAVQMSDSMVCNTCGIGGDINDPYQPACKKKANLYEVKQLVKPKPTRFTSFKTAVYNWFMQFAKKLSGHTVQERLEIAKSRAATMEARYNLLYNSWYQLAKDAGKLNMRYVCNDEFKPEESEWVSDTESDKDYFKFQSIRERIAQLEQENITLLKMITGRTFSGI